MAYRETEINSLSSTENETPLSPLQGRRAGRGRAVLFGKKSLYVPGREMGRSREKQQKCEVFQPAR